MTTFADSPPLYLTADQVLAALHAGRLLSPQHVESLTGMDPDETLDGRAWASGLVKAGALTAYQAEQLLAGRSERLVLGHYRIQDHLGAGGMGEVYKAEHLIMKRTVALKVIAPHCLKDASVVTDFQREVQVAAQLSHPNIVTAYDAAEANGVHFFVMEYVDGIDLGRLMKDLGPLPLALACAYVRQVALGLQHAHECGLVHCDIKPANLLVRRPFQAGPGRPALTWSDGSLEPPLVKILDFGLARLAGKPIRVGTASRTPLPGGSFAGTPDYMAPEQARDTGTADRRSDLYSLGCTFYSLLTGQVPYPGGTWAEKLLRHQFDPATPVTDLRPDAPLEVVTVVRRLMAKNPDDRYSTAAEVAKTLQALAPAQDDPLDSPPIVAVSAAVKTHFTGDGLTLPSSSHRVPSAPAHHTPRSNAETPDPGKESATFERAERPSPKQRPRRLLRQWPVAASILVGLLSAWVARPPSRVAPEISPRARTGATAGSVPFRLGGTPGKAFARLQEAVDAAQDNDTILVDGNGPLGTPPVRIDGKALTLKAGPGFRPKIELAPDSTAPGWQPVLAANRPLALEGLELCRQAGGNPSANPDTTHLVYCEQAALRMTGCRLIAPRGRALVVCRNAHAVEFCDCHFIAHAAAVCVEAGNGSAPDVRLTGSRLMIRDPHGAALSLWPADARQATAVRLHLTGNTIEAGRIIALARLGQGTEVTAQDNTFTFHEALLSCAGFAGNGTWRQTTRWQGQDNCYRASGDWLAVDGVATGVRGLAAWRQFWHVPELGSREESTARPHSTASLGPTKFEP